MNPSHRTPRHWLLRRTPTDIPVWILVFQTGLSLAISPLPQRSLQAVWPHALGLVAYYVLARWPWSERQLGWAWWGLVLGAPAMALLGLAGVEAGGGKVADLPGMGTLARLTADSFNPNVVAGYLVLLCPFPLSKALATTPTGSRLQDVLSRGMATAASGLTLVGLFVTGSRAGLAAALVGVLLLLALRWPRVALRVGPVLLVIGAALAWRVNWARTGEALLRSGSVGGLEERVEIWSRALYIAQDFAFTGVGFGAFEPVVELMYPLFLISAGTASHAHNLLLQVAADLGLPGLIAFLSMLTLSAALLARTVRHTGDPLARACLVAGLAVLLHGLVDAAVWGNKGAAIPWAVLALAVPLFERSLRVSGRPAAVAA